MESRVNYVFCEIKLNKTRIYIYTEDTIRFLSPRNSHVFLIYRFICGRKTWGRDRLAAEERVRSVRSKSNGSRRGKNKRGRKQFGQMFEMFHRLDR